MDDEPRSNPLSALVALDAELDQRLSHSWISVNYISRKSLAFVDGRERQSTEPILRAAKVLGIELIVLDQSGHWLELHENACLRDRSVSLEMTALRTESSKLSVTKIFS